MNGRSNKALRQTRPVLEWSFAGERNASFGWYLHMAASLVTFGAIGANTEVVATFAKVQPFLAKTREVSGIPGFCEYLERVVRGASV